MNMRTRLQTKLNQSLVMTPQMQQAIHLLQLNNLELEGVLVQEITDNPFLERDGATDFESVASAETGNSPEKPVANTSDTPDTADITAPEVGGLDTEMREGQFPGSDATDADYENRWDSDEAGRQQATASHALTEMLGGGAGQNNPGEIIEQVVSGEVSFRDYLRDQIHDNNLPDDLKYICLTLIEWLDGDGYLREPDSELCAALSLSKEQLAEAVDFLQELQPVGICARSLPDRLRLQLREKGLWSQAYAVLLKNLDLLAKGEMTLIAQKCHVKKPELSRMVTNLRKLDPKITSRFENAASQVRPPEIIVRPASASDDNAIEGWHVELNDETLPKVLLLDRYWEELAAHKMTEKDRKYLSGNYQSGQWLVKTLNQRAVTMLRVAREIVRQQTAFLEDGVQYLKPMILADIAEQLDLHESTVSRVTAGKLIETPRGMFELKFFFTTGLNRSDGGGEHSAAAVRARIEKLVMQETIPVAKGVKPKILSDDALAKALQADGVDIARRTVAKYREALGIPSSAQRKRTARLSS